MSSPYAVAGHLVTLHDLETLEEATYLQVSPKGDMIAYVWKDRLWIASTQTGNSPRQFERAKVPRWSQDGQKIAYYSDESGANQLWVLDVHKGSAEQVTNLPQGINPDPHSRRVVVICGQRAQMPQEVDSESQAHSLCSAQHQITAGTGQDRFALIAEEYQTNRKHEQANLLLRKNVIDQPPENEWSE